MHPGLPLGGQAEPTRRALQKRFAPILILIIWLIMVAVGATTSLAKGHFAAAGAMLLATIASAALTARYLYDGFPQRAWLHGSVLTVETQWGVRRCDLSSASTIRFRHTLPQPATRITRIPVLYARQQENAPPLRLLLEGPDLLPLPLDHLRLLADVLESRPEAGSVVRRLRDLADEREALLPKPPDWSFRTDPQGLRRPGAQ